MYGDHMTGAGWATMLLWTNLIVLLAGGVIWAMLATSRSGPPSQATPPGSSMSARELLDQRFARGEIDADEYQQAPPHPRGTGDEPLSAAAIREVRARPRLP